MVTVRISDRRAFKSNNMLISIQEREPLMFNETPHSEWKVIMSQMQIISFTYFFISVCFLSQIREKERQTENACK